MRIACAIWLLSLGLAEAQAQPKRVLIVAGPPSHGPGVHRFPAGAELLAEAVNRSGADVRAEAVVGWPSDPGRVGSADLVVLYSDGLGDHVAKGRAADLRARWQAGRALAVLHFALEPPEDEPELARLLSDAVGGRFEADWSVNPVWRLQAAPEPSHPAAGGVGPIDIEDEWYFHLRLRPDVRPLLAAEPPAAVVQQDGPRSGNPAVRAALARGERQVVAWTVESDAGARGFGFTGGHAHRHWYDTNQRRLVVNALLWTLHLEIPPGGFALSSPTVPLHGTIDEAVARGDQADVRRHLAADPARVHGAPGAKLNPLHQAILRKQTPIALLLLSRGADPKVPDSSGRTPLHLAVDRADLDVVWALLANGADPAVRDKIGWTPLHHAAAKDQVRIAQTILDAGLDPNVRSERGGTPLHEAAASGGAELAKLLLARGTDPAIRSATGATALDIAREFGNEAAIAVLESAAAK
ncbi:MAG TPA: ankyrin repeat domain-containing protein [Opitutaceae bacterium]|nr:ankyrin repeat domain-containing protein [Opitutaceae bacterium]